MVRVRIVTRHVVRAQDISISPASAASVNNNTETNEAKIFPFSPADTLGISFNRVQGAWFYPVKLDSNRLRLALALVLPRYPHLAGRIFKWDARKHTSSDPEFVAATAATNYRPVYGFALNNAGVPFNEAIIEGVSATDFSYEDQQIVRSLELGKPLLISKDGDTVCCAQYGEFADGSGSMLTVTTVHSLVDAQIFYTFVAAWASMYRHLATTDQPLANPNLLEPKPLYKPSLMGFPPLAGNSGSKESPSTGLRVISLSGALKAVWSVLPLVSNRALGLHFPQKELEAMKRAASVGLAPGEYITSNDIIAAQLWRTMCVLRDLSPTTVTRYAFFVDMRTRHPSLPPEYAGGAVTVFATSATAADITNAPFTDVVRRVHEATQSARKEALEKELSWVAQTHSNLGRTQTIFPNVYLPHDLFITSWTKFDVFGADFTGDNCASTFFMSFPPGIACGAQLLPAPPMLGDGILALMYLKKSHYDALRTEEWKQRLYQTTAW